MGRPAQSHPRPSCHAAIVHDGRILLIQRGHDPYKGRWGFPGGGVELGETVAEALRREVYEETGLQVAVGPFLALKDAIGRGNNDDILYHYVILFFAAFVVAGDLRAGDDAAQALWVPKESLNRHPLVPGAEEIMSLIGFI